jgi:hypothetical protein
LQLRTQQIRQQTLEPFRAAAHFIDH